MLGYTREELLATSLLTLTHADDLAETREVARALLAGEREDYAFEQRLRARDGRFVWAQVTTHVRRSVEDIPLHLLSYILDITDRKKSDSDLRESETPYRRLFELAKDGVLSLDADTGFIIDVNPFMTEMTGYLHDDFLGKQLWELGFFKDAAASQASFAEFEAKGYVRYDDLPLKTRDGLGRFAVHVLASGGCTSLGCGSRNRVARTVRIGRSGRAASR